jgi:hypothetical protein
MPTPCRAARRTDGRPIGVTVDQAAKFTKRRRVQLVVSAPDGATTVSISNDGGFAHAVTRPLGTSESIPWALESSGPERLPKTVYVRFAGACIDSSQTFQDDIILDETPPRILRAHLAAVRGPRKGRRLLLRATDNASGLSAAQIRYGLRAKARIVAVKFRRVIPLRQLPSTVRVRVRDGAGNYSRWSTAHT